MKHYRVKILQDKLSKKIIDMNKELENSDINKLLEIIDEAKSISRKIEYLLSEEIRQISKDDSGE